MHQLCNPVGWAGVKNVLTVRAQRTPEQAASEERRGTVARFSKNCAVSDALHTMDGTQSTPTGAGKPRALLLEPV